MLSFQGNLKYWRVLEEDLGLGKVGLLKKTDTSLQDTLNKVSTYESSERVGMRLTYTSLTIGPGFLWVCWFVVWWF